MVFDLFFGKLASSSSIKSTHSAYKNCIANQVENYMKTGSLPSNELCLNEKESFYNTLHKEKKIEHDNILLFSTERILNGYHYK